MTIVGLFFVQPQRLLPSRLWSGNTRRSTFTIAAIPGTRAVMARATSRPILIPRGLEEFQCMNLIITCESLVLWYLCWQRSDSMNSCSAVATGGTISLLFRILFYFTFWRAIYLTCPNMMPQNINIPPMMALYSINFKIYSPPYMLYAMYHFLQAMDSRKEYHHCRYSCPP